MCDAKQGDWVQIYDVILPAGERAAKVPEDTQRVSLALRVKGFLLDAEGRMGRPVTVKTVTGRSVQGELCAVMPAYRHDFGEPQPELLAVGPKLREILWGDGSIV
ncbi:MAG: 2-amino-4-oxopentanoate thiolase subunit OrtA [Peptococcaceae bacterium]|nr:2-amino-4-oxopentanoate thiolase subunit OrtA [Peptococcaceae bacterium]